MLDLQGMYHFCFFCWIWHVTHMPSFFVLIKRLFSFWIVLLGKDKNVRFARNVSLFFVVVKRLFSFWIVFLYGRIRMLDFSKDVSEHLQQFVKF
jgi:hypothetical protein